ncbi:MAG: TrpB-like pyridoxal-phosphate dependent enzyme, partial [Chloroflexi bacterium]|nr:TrpB-like pyridoxal-phosphate dependent enzyme [Chloroflexota bacterium]
MGDQYKFVLAEEDIPKAWYNINPDMPVNPAETAWNAVLHPGTKEPVTPEFLNVLFPMRFIGEAMSMDRWV